ncbi:MAG: hypothetical protein HY481_01125 [Candidatus Vogelbacteria bacterium]|nr:hypothetical protein [Candidatus Vogelbacteria bacterium]
MNGDNQMNQFPIADKPSRGPMLGIVIIIILIILGGIYILSSRSGAPEEPPADTSPIPTESPAGRDDIGQTPDLTDLETEARALETDLQNLDREATQ